MSKPALPILAAAVAITAYLAWAPGTAQAPISAVVDTDMGLDDVRAVLALLADPSVEIGAFVTIEGSASLGKATDNLIGLLEEAGAAGAVVLRGTRCSDCEPPPWRETANSLAGHPFAPPRGIVAIDEQTRRMTALMKSSARPLHYLALGPLGNLALLEEREPGSLGRIDAIWIPASISSGDAVDAWNLSCDRSSTISVTGSARNIVLVDLARSRPRSGLEEIFAGVRGPGLAARWICEVRSSASAHSMLCDELTALAAIRPDMIAIAPERFALVVEQDGSMRLRSDRNGSIRVARFIDPDEAVRELVRLWGSGTSTPDAHDSTGSMEPELYMRAFHGHLGPYVVLGYRMGRIALRELDSPGYFGLSAIVHSPLTPPRSCLIDGIQLGSGCTLGKRNIDVRATDGPAWVVFRSDSGGEVTIGLEASMPGIIDGMISESGVERAGAELMHMDERDLFEIIRPACRPAP